MASLETIDRLRARTGVTYDEAREALDTSDGDMLDALIWLENKGKITPPRISYYSTDMKEGDGADDFSDMPYGRTAKYYDSKEWQKMNAQSNNKGKKDNKNQSKKDNMNYKGAGQNGKQTNKNTGANKKSGTQAYYYDESDNRAKTSTFAQSAGAFISKAFHIGNTSMFEITRYGQDIIKIPLTILVVICCIFLNVTLVLIPLGLFFGFRYKLTGNMFDDSAINKILKTLADAIDGIKDNFNGKKRQ